MRDGRVAEAPKLNPWWITGFTDGEGCFSSYVYDRGNRVLVEVGFAIQLREDDAAILYQMQGYFGCGLLRTGSRAAARAAGQINARDQISYYVKRPCDLIRAVIPHFDRHLPQSKKLADYLIWREIVLLVEARHMLFATRSTRSTSKGKRDTLLTKIVTLSAQLRETRNPGLRRSPRDLVFVNSGGTSG